MPRILLLVILLLLYGSLYPWDFHYRPLDAGIPAILMRSWPVFDRFTLRDAFINVVIYFPLGAAAYFSCRRRLGPLASAGLAILAGAGLSTAIELAQIYDRGRTPSAFDICCNTAGTILGVAATSLIRPHLDRIAAVRDAISRAPAAAALLLLWAGHQLYPLMPSFSTYTLWGRLRHLAHPRWPWPGVFTEAAAWIGVAVLAKAVARKHGRAVFTACLLLAPARLLIAGRGPSAADFLGAAIALVAVLAAWRRITPALGAALLIAALGVRELAPFHLGPRNPHGFSWIPFAGTLDAEWTASLAIVLRKAVEYGMTVWVLWATGAGWFGAAILVAGLLAAGEAIQIWLPGRTPEITDPLLAVLMAFLLRTLQRQRPANR